MDPQCELTAAQAAEVLGVRACSITRMCRKGIFEGARLAPCRHGRYGRQWVIPAGDLLQAPKKRQLQAGRKTQPPAPSADPWGDLVVALYLRAVDDVRDGNGHSQDGWEFLTSAGAAALIELAGVDVTMYELEVRGLWKKC